MIRFSPEIPLNWILILGGWYFRFIGNCVCHAVKGQSFPVASHIRLRTAGNFRLVRSQKHTFAVVFVYQYFSSAGISKDFVGGPSLE